MFGAVLFMTSTGVEQLTGRDLDAGGGELLRGGIGDEAAELAPAGDAVRRGAPELGGVEAEEGFGRALADGLLKRGDLGVGIGDAVGVHAFAAKQGDIEMPVRERAHGVAAEERGLAPEEGAAEHVEIDVLVRAEHGGDGEVVGDEREAGAGVALAAECAGDGEDGGAGVEEDRAFGGKKREGGGGDLLLRAPGAVRALGEGVEGDVVVGQGAAAGAGDVALAGDDGEIAARGGFRNLESPANLGQRQETVDADQLPQSLPAGIDDVHGDAHRRQEMEFI